MSNRLNVSLPKLKERGVVVPASQTLLPIGQIATPNADFRALLRYDIIVGKVVAAVGPTITLQDSSGYNIWNTVKASSALTASTNKTCTFSDTTDIVTSAGHGFTDGQAIAFTTTGTLPVGLFLNKIYYVKYIDANTFQLAEEAPGMQFVNIQSAGTGTTTACLVRVVSIALNNEVAGDQSVLPVRSQIRLACTTGAGDSVQVMDIRAQIGA